MSLHDSMFNSLSEFFAWLTGQPQQPEPVRIPVPVEDEPQRRPRRRQ